MQAISNADRWARIGSLFQFPMVGMFGAELVLFSNRASDNWILQLPHYLGLGVFLWCLYFLYVRRARLTGLVTNGPFRYTRHPMYLGLLVMNLTEWIPSTLWTSPLFLVLESLFIVCMVAAAYCQERETLERFGQDAVDYYKRTPRIPFTPW